uniref:Ig-like domain-containing protein n=1 Tax=Caenorhabditis japonica TaxID=281687 RepID=A0A8R1I7V3_CAEJA
MHSIDLNPLSRPELVLVSGSMMTFTCDLDNRVKKRKKHEEIEFIEWFVNGKRIKPSWFDWRVSISWDGKLGIWPINEGDSGIFECLSNGQLKASVNVVVVPMSKVFLDGLINYLLVCAIFGLATISMGCLLGDRNVETKHTEVDRMEEFLEENVFKTDQMAKEKVKAIIADQGKIDERQIVENKGKGNRSTIMLLLQNANVQNPRKAKETTMNEAKNSDTQNKESSDEKPAELEKNKTELETKKKEDPEEEEDEDDDDDSDEEDEDVAADNGSSTTSKDSKTSSDSKTGKSKDSKKPKKKKTKKGKKKKDGKKKGTKNKKKGAGKGKKKASKGTKATAKKTKGTKKK